MCHATSGLFEWTYHVQTPHCKRPCYWDCIQCSRQLMTFLPESLTAFAILHQILSCCSRSRPIETMAESLGYDRCCRCMMTALALMNISEQIQPSVFFYTSLKNAGCTLAHKLIVDYCVFPRPTTDLSWL